MKKRLFTVLISIFMIIMSCAIDVFADDLGDTPTIKEIASTRPDFVFGNNNSGYGWKNSNQYKLWFDYGPEYLCLSYGSGYSNEIKVLVETQTTKDGNNYKIVTTDGVKGGNIDIVFVMNNSNVLDYIEVTAPNSPDVGGKYGRTFEQILENFPNELDSAWANENESDMYYDSNNSCLKIVKGSSAVEIPGSSILTYSENAYTHKDGEKTIVFNLYTEPEPNWAAIKNIVVSGYDSNSFDGTYTFLHAGDERWIGLWGNFTSSTSEEREFKIKANDDVETFTIIEALDNIAEGAIILPDYAYDTNGFEYYITGIADNVFKEFSIFYLEIDGDHLEYIGEEAFKNCSNLNTVVFYSLDTPPTLGTGVFDGCSDDLVIYVPNDGYNAYLTDSTWLPYKDKLVPFYLVRDLINSNPEFPRFIPEVSENLVFWKNSDNDSILVCIDYGDYCYLSFMNGDDIYYDIEDYYTVIMKDDGNFELDCGDGILFEFIMNDDVLTSIVASGMENCNYDEYDYSVLNGTYQVETTIADILPTSFPTSETAGWIKEENGKKVYLNDTTLKFNGISISIDKELTKDGNNYTITEGQITYTFNMESGVLKSIELLNPMGQSISGTYVPYKYTTTPTSKPEGYTGELEFVTNAVYTNDNDVTVKVDGTTLTLDTDYTLSHGSTHVKLKGDYVKTLAVGTHVITIGVTGYDEISSDFTITNSSSTPGSGNSTGYKIPKTGVEGTPANSHSLLKQSSLSLLAIGTYMAIKKKKDNE